MTTPVDHDRPHWCDHDGLDALVPPPSRLFYIGQSDANGLVTRGCPLSSAPGEPTAKDCSGEANDHAAAD
jgi:hypothetical protein